MTREEFHEIHFLVTRDRPIDRICIDELTNKTPRRLVYGYTLEKYLFVLDLVPVEGSVEGVCFKRELIKHPNEVVHSDLYYRIPTHLCIPTKGMYPHESDYEFVKILIDRGRILPLTAYIEEYHAS